MTRFPEKVSDLQENGRVIERRINQETIDFTSERRRHRSFQGREDVLGQLDGWLLGRRTEGYVLVTGGPGMGKSAILDRWLRRQEDQGRPWPHHFLRRGHKDWAQPAAVNRNLAAQIEARFPEQRDPEALPERRFDDLLARVSREVLEPRGERLILVLDGLDEAAVVAQENPLQLFVPWTLPAGVLVLCASRPTYPHLSWLEGRDGVFRLDLDAPEWVSSNEAACLAYWQAQEPLFEPPLPPGLVNEAIHRGAGNLLYAVKLSQHLAGLPPEKRRAERLPRGLEGFLEETWQRFMQDRACFPLLKRGLGLLCAAREALPPSILDQLLGGELEQREALLARIREVLLEEPAAWRGEAAYRLYHDSFRGFIEKKLGGEAAMRSYHGELADKLAPWPAGDDPFRRAYALRHGILHRVEAGRWADVRALSFDLVYLEAKLGMVGLEATEGDLDQASRRCQDERQKKELRDLVRALRAESHWLRQAAQDLAGLLYNRLINIGWLPSELIWLAGGRQQLLLRYPLQHRDMAERSVIFDAVFASMCAISPDGKRAVSGSGDMTLKVWDIESGRELFTLLGHSDGVSACAISPDGKRALSGSDDKTLKVWDLESGHELFTFCGHSAGVSACAISSDGKRALSAAWDCTLKVWDMESGCELFTFLGHSDNVRACAVSPDGKRAISGSNDKTLKVWDMESGRELFTFLGHSDNVRACAVSPDGKRAVSGSDDKTLKVWDMENGRELFTLLGHSDMVRGCTVSPDGKRVISYSRDATLKVWDMEGERVPVTLSGHSDGVSTCAVSADGKRAASGSWDSTLKVWDLESGRELFTLSGHSDVVSTCAVSADGKRAVSGSVDKTLKVWDLESGRELFTLSGHSDRVSTCAVSPDGRRAISGSDDRTLKVWDLENGRELVTLVGHHYLVRACALSSDGKRAVSGSWDNMLKVWDLESGREVFTLSGHSDKVNACAVSLDGKRAVSGSDDHMLKVWDLESGREVFTLSGHSDAVEECVLSPDGKRAVSSSWDSTLKVWDMESGRELFTLLGHSSRVSTCAVSPDGKRAASGSIDRTLKLWDLISGDCVVTVYGGRRFGSLCLYGSLLVAGDDAGNVWMLELHEPPSDGTRDIDLLHTVGAPPPLFTDKRHALVAGINHYDDSAFAPLRYCTHDAIALAQLLPTLGYQAPTVLHDGLSQRPLHPKRNVLRRALRDLASTAGPGDLLLFYFAGHGCMLDGKPVLVPMDADHQEPETLLPLEEVERILQASRCKRQVLLLDACHVGVDRAGPEDPEAFIRNVYDSARGFVVLAASTAWQVAQESPEQQHGVFTGFLLQGLAGQARRDQRPFVTVNDLKEYLVHHLAEWARLNLRRVQEPSIRDESVGTLVLADFRGKGAD